MAKNWQYALVTVLASGPIYFEVLPGLFSAPALGLATLLVPYVVATFRLGHRETLRRILIGSSAVLGIFSVLTGYVNYLTDEWATPQYVSLILQGHRSITSTICPSSSRRRRHSLKSRISLK